MRQHLVLCGGVGHPFAETSTALGDVLAAVLAPAGLPTVVVEPDGWEEAVAGIDDVGLLTVNALRWLMKAPRYDELRAENQYRITPTVRAAIERHLMGGGALLSLHTGCICFDDWPAWGQILGASWDWDHSFHPAYGDRVVLKDSVTGRRSVLRDELYHDLAVHGDREVLATATLPPGLMPMNPPPRGPGITGAAQPVLWRRHHGGGRVVVDTLGHDRTSLADATHGDALRAAVAWSLAPSGTPA